ncbi:MAG TPA: radical SAM protein [Vicinamibacterales bacterium]|nr:radical SAM protein [Vicinamibacterales bacterium]
MNVLLFSMPDSFEHTPSLTMRMPNGALASLAGNVDPHHTVAVADLILAQASVPETVARLVTSLEPDIVGLSVMTFQRKTAFKVIKLVRALRPQAAVVVGGYDPSLAPEHYENSESGVDFIVSGEGDITFRELVRALEKPAKGAGLSQIAGLSYRDSDGRFVRNPARAVSHLDGEVRPPNRAARVLTGYTILGRPVDIVETSRGCTYDCSFCSIIEMRGRNFHTWSYDRVIADIADAKQRGARAIFLVDDNITLNVARFKGLCEAIVDAGLNDIDYIVQGMTSAIASSGDELGAAMRAAGFRYVFLGIENVLEQDLAFLKATAKNAQREGGRTIGSATMRAVEVLHRHGMLVVGGLIVGNPGDTRESIDANLDFARKHVDWPYIQHPTPYPGTPMTRDFRDKGLIVNESVEEYDGTTAVVRTEHLEADEIEFMRWRAERWMKCRHLPKALAHDPVFVMKHWPRMLGHTFRGSTWRTWLGLESERVAFRRYKAIRRTEREFFPDSTSGPGATYIGRSGFQATPSQTAARSALRM